MKKTLLFIFSLLTLSLLGQDGINYQGAATDANGDELTNQNISIRASVLSTSANGNLEWEESHSTTTDQFGLFNVVIGQGTNTTNGATATFDDMDWGSGNHFLKIEMDATGGTNYAMIGTTQMMSVPYALYAKSAGIDSTMLANMIGSSGGGMGGGGCNYAFPEGLDGVAIVHDFNQLNSYIVPTGKRLYVTSHFGSSNLYVNSITVNEHAGDLLVPAIANAGDILSTANSGNGSITGLLVNESSNLQAISHDLYGGTYTVPAGKRLYVTRSGYFELSINSILVNNSGSTVSLAIAANSGDILSGNAGAFNGYLVDENYFANCGGGGSSGSASAVDSAMVAGMIANAGGGGNMAFGKFEDITSQINNNLTNTSPYPEYQQNEDGFLYIILNPSNQWFQISIDSVSMLPNGPSGGYYHPNSLSNMSLLIPLKKDYYWTFSAYNTTVNKAFWIPLESGGGGSSSGSAGTMSVSTFGDTLTMNGQSIIVPGISFSNVVPVLGSVTDIDSNTYQTVSYGNVEWMTENLTTTTFSDGTPISQICQCDNGGSCFCNQPGWCNYAQSPSFDDQYGKLYTGYTIASNSNVCPTGWHVSNTNDWDMLTDLFVSNGVGTNGGSTTSGNASSLLLSQTNESYLSLQLGGYNNGCGGGSNMGSTGQYWITDPNLNNGNAYADIIETSGVYYIYLGYASIYNYKYIRCVKD